MYQNCCKKCGSIDLFIRQSGNNVVLYCKDCGAWIKWLGKDESRAFEESQKNSVSTENNNIEDKSKELYEAALPLLEFMNKHYCPMDIAVLTEGKVEIFNGNMGVLLPVRD